MKDPVDIFAYHIFLSLLPKGSRVAILQVVPRLHPELQVIPRWLTSVPLKKMATLQGGLYGSIVSH